MRLQRRLRFALLHPSRRPRHARPLVTAARRIAALALLGALAGAALAQATLCALDNVPAATLLLPYFEVDLSAPDGRTTLMAVTNASAAATLVHVVLWTDLAVPTLGFDVYLTGYDVQTLNLRDVLAGRLPVTADAAHDPTDTISPRGPDSHDVIVEGCDGLLPLPPLAPAAVDAIDRAHLGLPAPPGPGAGTCSGQPHGDGIARGYVTVDVATRCSALVPGDDGYFGPGGVAGYANVLIGDFFYVDSTRPGGPEAAGFNLVRIEADPLRFGFGSRTFYRTRVGGSGADGREPLPTIWGQRYLNGGPIAGATDLIVWRDVERPGAPVPCGSAPAWYPLGQLNVLAFDEQERAVTVGGCNPGGAPCPPLPPFDPLALAANRASVTGAGGLQPPFTFGWLLLDLNTSQVPPSVSQAWVGAMSSAGGTYRVGLDATPFDSGCNPTPLTPF